MPALVVFSPPAIEPVSISEVLQHCRIDASNQEPAPTAITVTLGSVAGIVDNGVHRYLSTYVTADGETQGGDISTSVTVTDNTTYGKVELTNIPLGGGFVIARRIYRTVANGSVYFLLTTIADNTTTAYTDNIADASLGVEAPSTNTTADPLLGILIESARQHAEAVLKRYLITQTIDLYLDCFPDWEIKLPPLQSVSAITYIDNDGITQTLASDQYLVDATSAPARITPSYGLVWPYVRYQNNAVKIRFIAGYGDNCDVPSGIKSWILMRIKQRYDQRDAVNVGGSLTEFPRSYVDGLLDPHKVYL